MDEAWALRMVTKMNGPSRMFKFWVEQNIASGYSHWERGVLIPEDVQGRMSVNRLLAGIWHAPSHVGAMRTGSVLKLVIFFLALAVLLPFSEIYLARWIYGPRFTQVALVLLIDKTQSLLGLLSAVPHQNLQSILRGVPADQLQLAGMWAWILFGSTVLPMLLILCVVIGHHTWNSVSTWLDILHPPKDT